MAVLENNLKVHLVDHPLAQEVLTTLRDRKTGVAAFRRGLARLGCYMGIELSRKMKYTEVDVKTPMGVKSKGVYVTDAHNVIIINVLRAAMPFVEGLLEILPDARVGVVSARRIEEDVTAPEYNFKIDIPNFRVPPILREDTVIVADPMLASGSTVSAVLKRITNAYSPKRVVIASVVSAPLGVERVNKSYPSVEVYTLALDKGLNQRGYIVPGLGDAGDRVCG